MKRIILIFLLLTVGISPAVAAPIVGITGTIDDQFGEAVGILVYIDSNNTTVTDAGGYYSIDLQPGTYNITYSKVPEYETLVVNNVIVNYSLPYHTPRLDTVVRKPTGIITGTVTAPCIPATAGGCYSGYEPPYTLFTIPYYQGESVDVLTGPYDDVLMFEAHSYTDYVEVQNNTMYSFSKSMVASPLRIYTNSSIAVVHKRTEQRVLINPLYALSHNIHTDVLIINQASVNIVANLGNNYSIEYFGYDGQFNFDGWFNV